MAEVLGILASGISIVQIAAQLLACVRQLQSFSRTLRNIPEDLYRTLDELELLGEVFHQVDVLKGSSSATQSARLLDAGLAQCRAAASALDKLLTQVNTPFINHHSKNRRWKLLKAGFEKDGIDELRNRLEAAKSLLHLAMTCHSLNLQQQHVTMLEVQTTRLTPSKPIVHNEAQPRYLVSTHAQQHRFPRSSFPPGKYVSNSACLTKKCYCVCHKPLVASGSFWTLDCPIKPFWGYCDLNSCASYKHASLWIDLSWIGVPYAMKTSLAMVWTAQRTSIAPSLEVKRVVSWDAPTFRAIRDIRWNSIGFEEARANIAYIFRAGKGSPADILASGETLVETLLSLPWPNGDIQQKLLEFFVHSGADINNARLLQQCSRWKGLGVWNTGDNDHLAAHTHLMSKLISIGLDPSEIEALSITNWPQECSPMPISKHQLRGDPFFVEWMSEGVKVCPGFAGLTPLQEAVLIGSSDDVVAQLSHSKALPDRNMFLQSALHLAIWRPQHLQTLLQGDLDINQPDWAGRTPLMYAAATEAIEVALSLVEAGANLWRKDDLFMHDDFLHYAVNATHWHLVLAILDFVGSKVRDKFSATEVQELLDAAITLWAKQPRERRNSEHLHALLALGADPNVVFECTMKRWSDWRSEQATLLHRINTIADFDILVASGFHRFNHENNIGAHPLMYLARLQDPHLVQKCVDEGSLVNHQDHAGHTTLFAIAQDIRNLMCLPLTDIQYNYRGLKKLDCSKVLLKNGADAFLGDKCQCACSAMGCTPGHILLKEGWRFWCTGNISALPRCQYYLGLEWLDLIREVNGSEMAKQCVRDIVRLTRFERLGLTHTCCRKLSSEENCPWTYLEEEEVDEIQDEEKEMITDLEFQMKKVEPEINNSGVDVETLVFEAINILIEIRNRRQRSLFLASRTANSKDKCTEPEPCTKKVRMGYIPLIEHRRAKKIAAGDTEEKWYNTRMNWASKFPSHQVWIFD